jgi:hypothetical protein
MDSSTPPPSKDSQAAFSSSVRLSLHEKYRDRCVVCLKKLPAGGFYSRVIDTPLQVSTAAEEGVLPAEYDLTSEENGMLRECIHLLEAFGCGSTRLTLIQSVPPAIYPSFPAITLPFRFLSPYCITSSSTC